MPDTANNPLEFELHGTVIRLRQSSLHLLSLAVEGETWFAGAAEGSALWQIVAVDEAGRHVTLDGAMAARSDAEVYGGVLLLNWHAVVDAATGAGPFDVRVEVRPTGREAGITGWKIEVTNHSEWTLWNVTFPKLDGLAPSANSEQDRLFYPLGWGTQQVGWSQMSDLRCRYPRGWDFAMQLLGYTRGTHTFSLATHDPELTTKQFNFTRRERDGEKQADFAVLLFPEGMSIAGNHYRQQFETIIAVQRGDWYDAAQLYAGWARHQAWACCPQAPRAEDHVQGWQVLMVPDKPLDEWGAQMEQLAEYIGVKLGTHFYNWHQIPFDASYPDYFPAREGFRELAARLKRAGILTMPYINGRLWDINAPSWPAREAMRYAAKGSGLRVRPLTLFNYLEEYGSGQKLSPMCPVTDFWQDTVIDLCTRIITELDCDGVYIDQIAAEKSELCFDPEHGHPLGGGGFWLVGYRRMLQRIREAVPQAYLTTECNWEGCAADYDGLLTWHSFGDKLIPLFPAVYAGLAKTFGCQFADADITANGGFTFTTRMGMLFVWGAQLGWGDLTPLLKAENALLLEYFTMLCRQRALHQQLFTTGRLLRTPTTSVSRQQGAIDEVANEGSATSTHIHTSLWQQPDRSGAMVFLVNPGRTPLQVDVSVTAAECAGMTVGDPLQGGFTLLAKSSNPPAFTTTLPALSVLAVPLG